MPDFDIKRLWIGHWPKPPSGATVPDLGALRSQALLFDTCLRQVIVTTDPEVAHRASHHAPAEWATGAPACQFLLEITAGLRSAVAGETNVFGQFKRSWESFRHAGDVQVVAALAPIIAQVIRATRDIRHQHLQNIGGASYGALVRRLIRPDYRDPILIVGAGELARTLLPFFRGFPLGIWNRRAVGPLFTAAARLFTADDGPAAAVWAKHAVMTTPADEDNDRRWQEWLSGTSLETLVHLGRRREPPWQWPTSIRAYDLDDVFDLRRSQANVRCLQLERARRACRDRAHGLAEASARPERYRAFG
jgi:hypothetical protein